MTLILFEARLSRHVRRYDRSEELLNEMRASPDLPLDSKREVLLELTGLLLQRQRFSEAVFTCDELLTLARRADSKSGDLALGVLAVRPLVLGAQRVRSRGRGSH